jgi:hypothetical protein
MGNTFGVSPIRVGLILWRIGLLRYQKGSIKAHPSPKGRAGRWRDRESVPEATAERLANPRSEAHAKRRVAPKVMQSKAGRTASVHRDRGGSPLPASL